MSVTGRQPGVRLLRSGTMLTAKKRDQRITSFKRKKLRLPLKALEFQKKLLCS